MTPELLRRCVDTKLIARAVIWATPLTAAMGEFDINIPIRQAAWFAQIGHESGGLQFMEEIWGPTDAQRRYEPPGDLAEHLGNTKPGDGKRFKGKGPIQITGRFNYRKYGLLLGLDLEAHPELLDDPLNACRASACFWKHNGCNEQADLGNFITITRRINGGTNGLVDRQRRWEIAKNVLGVTQ